MYGVLLLQYPTHHLTIKNMCSYKIAIWCMLLVKWKVLLGSPYNHLKEGRASCVNQLLNEAIPILEVEPRQEVTQK